MENMTEKKVFSPEEAERFFRKNSFEIPEDQEASNLLGCIDDRDTEKRIGVPGSAIGFYMSVFGTIDDLNLNVDDKEKLCSLVNSVVGGAMHTDEKSIQNNETLLVAGCGHCSGILKRGELNSDYSDFLKNHYLKKISEQKNPLVYKGPHKAKGVFVINDLKTGLVSNDGVDQAFVYNKSYHDKLLDEITEKVYPFLEKINPGITKEGFSKSLIKTSGEQLKKTLDHLTVGLPVFEKGK
jgi:hypothetical protein